MSEFVEACERNPFLVKARDILRSHYESIDPRTRDNVERKRMEFAAVIDIGIAFGIDFRVRKLDRKVEDDIL